MVNLDYLYNPNAVKPHFNENYFVNKKLGFQVIEHGMILPHKKIPDAKEPRIRVWGLGGVFDSKGEFIRNTHVNITATEPMQQDYTPPELIQYSSETVIYLGIFFPVWGHVLTDNVRRLWFLKSDAFKDSFKNCQPVYVPWENCPLESQENFRRFLEVLEVDVDKIKPITQPTRFDKIILPDESFDTSKLFTDEYRATIDQIRDFALKNRTPTASKKIYYFYGRKQVGEERLAEYLKSKGYEIVRPEKLTFDEQLNLLINCESFASTLGSISHNSLFLRDGTETIFIPRNFGSILNSFQRAINQVHPLEISYVDSTFSVFKLVDYLSCYVLSEKLKLFFGDKWSGYAEDDFKTFLQYIRNATSKGLVVSLQDKEYYGEIFLDFMEQLKQREDLITAYNMPPRWETFQPTLSYQTHVSNKGWIAWQNEEQISGSVENNFDIQAVKIKFPNHKVYYSVYYNAEEGWSEEVSNGEQAGTTGKFKAIYGIRIQLDEVGQKAFDVLYRVHKFDGEWTPWAKNGEVIYSYGQKLNALQVKLEPKH